MDIDNSRLIFGNRSSDEEKASLGIRGSQKKGRNGKHGLLYEEIPDFLDLTFYYYTRF